jgi:hypothetical protein
MHEQTFIQFLFIASVLLAPYFGLIIISGIGAMCEDFHKRVVRMRKQEARAKMKATV